MSPKKPTTTIPLRIELEYMLDQRRLFQSLEWFTVASLQKFSRRADSAEILAYLGLSVPQVLDEAKLRRKLRAIAANISDQKLKELRAILGPGVRPPTAERLDNWIDEQVSLIQESVERWLLTTNRDLTRAKAAGLTLVEFPPLLRTLRQKLARQAEKRASNAILELNVGIIEEVARGAGSSHYRWDTTMDGRQRAWHGDLNGTIQSWQTPPAGGGTKSSDFGHPGSGYGCRCLPQPLEGRSPATRLQAALARSLQAAQGPAGASG